MRLSIFDRILLFLSMLAMLALGVFIILMAISVIPIVNVTYYFREVISTAGGMVSVILIAAVLILISVKLVMSLFTATDGGQAHEKVGEKIILESSDTGSIMISSDLIKDLAVRYAKASEDVKDVDCRIINEEGGVKLQLKFNLRNEVIVSDFLTKMQVDMREYVEKHSGVTIKNIDMCADVNQAVASKLR